MLLSDKNRSEDVRDDYQTKRLSVEVALDRSSDEDTHVRDEDNSKETTVDDEDLIPKISKVMTMSLVRQDIVPIVFPVGRQAPFDSGRRY